MKIPNSQKAVVPLSKISNYLLSETHAIGKSKARFLQALGFNVSNKNLLKEKLLAIARTTDIKESISTPYGIKYIVEGLLEAPNKTVVKVRTIWIIEKEENNPRFVTAYPL